MSHDHNSKERIAADILIAAIQARGAIGGGPKAEELAQAYQIIFEQVHSALSTANAKMREPQG